MLLCGSLERLIELRSFFSHTSMHLTSPEQLSPPSISPAPLSLSYIHSLSTFCSLCPTPSLLTPVLSNYTAYDFPVPFLSASSFHFFCLSLLLSIPPFHYWHTVSISIPSDPLRVSLFFVEGCWGGEFGKSMVYTDCSLCCIHPHTVV